jgi:hypothetical protein
VLVIDFEHEHEHDYEHEACGKTRTTQWYPLPLPNRFLQRRPPGVRPLRLADHLPGDLDGIRRRLGLHRSQAIVLRLSALFALDAFAGGFVAQSFIAFWFSEEWGMDPALLGALLAGANVLAGVSALAAAPLAARFGLIKTMVFTHLP